MPLQRRPNPDPQPHPHSRPQHQLTSSQRPSSYRKHALPPSPAHHRGLGPTRLSPRRELARVQHEARARTRSSSPANGTSSPDVDPRPQLGGRKFSFEVVHPWEVRDRHGAQLKVTNGAPASVDWDREVVAANVVRRRQGEELKRPSPSSSSPSSSSSSSVHTGHVQTQRDGQPGKDVLVPRPQHQQHQRSPRVTNRKGGRRPIINPSLLHPNWKPRAKVGPTPTPRSPLPPPQPKPQDRRQLRPRYYQHLHQQERQQVDRERNTKAHTHPRPRYYQDLHRPDRGEQ